MRSWKLEAFFIAVGLIVLGFLIKAGVTNRDKERVISVQGVAETVITAQKVTWPLLYKESGNDLNYLQYTVIAKNKLIIDYLKANGVTDDELYITPIELSDTQTDKQLSNRPYQRYIATSVIIVTSEEMEKVHKLISEQNYFWRQNVAITNDDSRYKVTYDYADFNSIKTKLTEVAIGNAREMADKLANSLKCEVKELKKASQGQFIFVDNVNIPYKKTLRGEITADFYLK
ncbi:hypothetical protein EZS27_008202 [termite gut metagenome]|uniref:SIMPL domain-containing protein n=1 Tax=termite gut metagenome TaxID=433724 RepID=A0A5J4SFV2_9ZZZZ